MRPPIIQIPALAAGTLALALFGTARLGVAGPQDPPATAPAPIAPASDAATAPAAPPKIAPASPIGPPTVLLLTNGRVLQGEVRKNDAGYVLKGKIGVSVFPRQQVERAFRSMVELYEYKK